MNAENNLAIKKITPDDLRLLHVIKFSIGSQAEDKILQVIKSYQDINQHLMGAFIHEQLIGIAGIEIAKQKITIRHLSVLPDFRAQGVGKALINFVTKEFVSQEIVVETDEEAVSFYQKSGFECHPFEGQYKSLRYQCLLTRSSIANAKDTR